MRTNAVIRFCLALAAEQTGVLLHCFCFMSNHWHGVLTDPHARLPEFIERFHRLVARAQNDALQRRENLWSTEKTSVIRLLSPTDILHKMAYTIANPTTARLVRSPDEWPGVVSSYRARDQQRVARPEVFFNEGGSIPKAVVLKTTRPPAYAHVDDLGFAQLLLGATMKLIRRARSAAEADGTGFVGAAVILRQSFLATPKTEQRRRSFRPKVASKSKVLRTRALDAMFSFVQRYRDALLRWREGIRDVVFPRGTYAMRVHHGACCDPA